jgi:hypothetical protein
MKKPKKEKTSAEPTEKSKRTARREFLSRTGLTAGGALMTTLAAGGISKGAQSLTTQQRLMNPDVFRKLFDQALTDKEFQNDIQTQGFKALEARGYQHGVPVEVQATLESSLFTSVGAVAKPKCGVCGVCGLCGLCGEVNLGSASAALWALFALAS